MASSTRSGSQYELCSDINDQRPTNSHPEWVKAITDHFYDFYVSDKNEHVFIKTSKFHDDKQFTKNKP